MSKIPGYRDTPIRPWHRDDPVDVAEAEEFLRLYHAEHPEAGPVGRRLRAVHTEIAATGTYVHTGPELTFGAKVAWRNASRCIGRLYWHNLLVLDRRHVTGADQIFHDLVTHLRIAGGGGPWRLDEQGNWIRRPGQIRPVMSVFAPAQPGCGYARVWNEQLIRYAGYRHG